MISSGKHLQPMRIQPQHEPQAAKGGLAKPSSSLVLVVDDEKSQRDLLSKTLSGTCRVMAVASVDEALAEARRTPPATVILDYEMPRTNGIEGLKKLRELYPGLPVVILTGHGDLDVARQAIQLGAVEYMLKPFELHDLISVVSRNISLADYSHRPGVQLPDHALPPADLRRQPAIVDLWRGGMPTVHSENRLAAVLASGQRFEAKVLRLNRHIVQVELYDPTQEVTPGTAITSLQVWVGEQLAYDGPGHINGIIPTGVSRVAEISVQGDWIHTSLPAKAIQPQGLEEAAQGFIDRWRATQNITPPFRLAVADAKAFLIELGGWLDGLELSWHHHGMPEGQVNRETLERLLRILTPAMNQAFAAFEKEAAEVPEPLLSLHAEYVRSGLHPLMLCSPFIHRCFTKPLGYPGDFGVMNRMLDDPFEGASLFAKLINAWVIRSAAGDAYRHRVTHLVGVLRREVSRVVAECGGPARVLSLGCGAARETQHFVRHDALSEHAQFTLMDFNPDTVQHAQSRIELAMQEAHRKVSVNVREFSVHQMLAHGSRLVTNPKLLRSGFLQRAHYDVIYCAGLFDYLSDRVCRRLLEIFWHLAAPGAVIVASNFAHSNPIKGFMDHVLDWRLLYRDEPTVRSLAVDEHYGAESHTMYSPDGVEIFLTMRKPVDASFISDDRSGTTALRPS